MKKIITILISLCLMLTVIAPSVFAYEQTSLSVSNLIQEDGTYLVTVKGTGEADSAVSITVIYRNGSGFAALEQCATNSSGIYTKTFPLRNPGEYTAIVNNYTSNSKATADFKIYSLTELNDAVNAFKLSTTITEMKNNITTYGPVFGFDTKFYTDDAQDAVATQMLSLKNSLTKENIIEKFDEANLRAYIYNLSTNIDEVVEYYDNLTSIVSSPVGMYEDYKALDENAKARVQNIAFETPVENIADLCEKFYMAIVAEKAKNNTNTEFDEFISNYTEYLGLDGYEDISTVKKSKLLNALKDSDIPDNTEDFAELYISLVKEINNAQKPSGGGGGGGGGGGASGGMGTIVTDPIGFETTEVLNTPAPDVTAVASFDDLKGYSWAENAITYLAGKGIVNGKTKTEFAPGDYITREEYAKIIVLAFGLYKDGAVCDFTDVASDRWSYKYIASIYGYGAVTGYPDGSFGASNPITREEMAVMLYRVMSKQMKIEIMSETQNSLNDFAEVSDFAKNSVTTLNHAGIISGDNVGNFNPKNNATRAEVCQMIYNSLNREGGRN